MIKNLAAQGELLLIRRKSLPEDLKEITPEKGQHIVGHSETGHHHTVEALESRYYGSGNPLICYLQIDGQFADLVHNRPHDKHAPLRLGQGVWEVRKQREHTPEGWRRVED